MRNTSQRKSIYLCGYISIMVDPKYLKPWKKIQKWAVGNKFISMQLTCLLSRLSSNPVCSIHKSIERSSGRSSGVACDSNALGDLDSVLDQTTINACSHVYLSRKTYRFPSWLKAIHQPSLIDQTRVARRIHSRFSIAKLVGILRLGQ